MDPVTKRPAVLAPSSVSSASPGTAEAEPAAHLADRSNEYRGEWDEGSHLIFADTTGDGVADVHRKTTGADGAAVWERMSGLAPPGGFGVQFGRKSAKSTAVPSMDTAANRNLVDGMRKFASRLLPLSGEPIAVRMTATDSPSRYAVSFEPKRGQEYPINVGAVDLGDRSPAAIEKALTDAYFLAVGTKLPRDAERRTELAGEAVMAAFQADPDFAAAQKAGPADTAVRRLLSRRAPEVLATLLDERVTLTGLYRAAGQLLGAVDKSFVAQAWQELPEDVRLAEAEVFDGDVDAAVQEHAMMLRQAAGFLLQTVRAVPAMLEDQGRSERDVLAGTLKGDALELYLHPERTLTFRDLLRLDPTQILSLGD
ncbi:MAG: hypothetical protein HY903_00780 [Deltaproteobacteria bacterium]|nr:hypothetical protein [Deltaproteobacteria bacterium]